MQENKDKYKKYGVLIFEKIKPLKNRSICKQFSKIYFSPTYQ